MDINQAREIVLMQEKLLLFDKFDDKSVWKLGNLMVEGIKFRDIDLSVSIKKPNGYIVFQYATDGTNLTNQKWMERKFNTVNAMEMSSMRATIDGILNKETIVTHGLSYSDYVLCGGGFPIRVKGNGIVGVAIASGLSHEEDHEFVVDCISRYLNIDNIPRLMDIEIPYFSE